MKTPPKTIPKSGKQVGKGRVVRRVKPAPVLPQKRSVVVSADEPPRPSPFDVSMKLDEEKIIESFQKNQDKYLEFFLEQVTSLMAMQSAARQIEQGFTGQFNMLDFSIEQGVFNLITRSHDIAMYAFMLEQSLISTGYSLAEAREFAQRIMIEQPKSMQQGQPTIGRIVKEVEKNIEKQLGDLGVRVSAGDNPRKRTRGEK